MDNGNGGDISIMLSSALISKIAQEYFNKVMFKQKVSIVDLRPASDGYMFVVEFIDEKKVAHLDLSIPSFVPASMTVSEEKKVRDSDGKFVKVKG